MGWRVCDSSSATALVSVGFWPHLQNRTPLPSRPLPSPSLLHRPAPSAGKLSEGLFSRMGSENSPLFVLAAVPFPVEEAWCPEDWG